MMPPDVPKSFVAEVDSALKHCRHFTRKGDWGRLGAATLTQQKFVTVQLWTDEQTDVQCRAQAAYAILQWAVEQLQPTTALDWHDGAWRPHLLISSVYFGDLTFEQVAQRVGITQSALYFTRRKALDLLASTLWQLAQSSSEDALFKACHDFVLKQRFMAVSAELHPLLKFLSVFDKPLLLSEYRELSAETNDDFNAKFSALRQQNLLQEQSDRWQVRPDLRTVIQTELSNQEQRHYFALSAEYYSQHGDVLHAAQCWKQANNPSNAIQLLTTHADKLLTDGSAATLQAMLHQFLESSISADEAALIRITLGNIAIQNSHLTVALQAYEKALTAPSVAIRATAYYRHANAMRRQQIDAALVSYQVSAELLAQHQIDLPLLLTIYLEQAHIYIQEHEDLVLAEQALAKANQLINAGDRSQVASLYDMLGTLAGKQGNDERAIEQYLQAYLAAAETQNYALLKRITHNLGMAYTWANRYAEGRLYVEKSLDLAVNSDDLQMQASCHKTLGVNHFFQEKFEQAITEYEKAYAIFEQLGNANWMAALACDLTEAYASVNNTEQANYFYSSADKLINQSRTVSLRQLLNSIAAEFPHILPSGISFNERQRVGYAYVKQHDSINRRTYIELTKTSPKTASRDLTALVKAGLFAAVGSGRSVNYVIVD